MRFKNRKSGQIGNFIINKDHFECTNLDYVPEYESISDLYKYWEDVDSGIYWFISDTGIVHRSDESFSEDVDISLQQSIGNHFGSKEEAELAVRKLQAWKRLKDKGFKFDGYDVANRGGDNAICGQAYFKAGNYDREEIKSDLDLLFGGEE